MVKFRCRIGSKILTGHVKERVEAKTTFDDAVVKGQTTGLLEQSVQESDVLSIKLGNIPANKRVVVEITCIGELKMTLSLTASGLLSPL